MGQVRGERSHSRKDGDRMSMIRGWKSVVGSGNFKVRNGKVSGVELGEFATGRSVVSTGCHAKTFGLHPKENQDLLMHLQGELRRFLRSMLS